MATWWRDIDAEQMVIVLDSCHSAAAPGKEFRAGPLGDPGFGQLAYDKGMLILTATESDKVAVAALREGVQGSLLSNALIELSASNEQQTIAEWFQDAARLVPEKHRRLFPNETDVQFPVVLNFMKRSRN